MALRLPCFRQISRFILHIRPGNYIQESEQAIGSSAISIPQELERTNTRVVNSECYFRRFSTVSGVSSESYSEVDLLSFIQYAFDEVKGPSHCWLNKSEGSKDFSKRDVAVLIIASQFLDKSLSTSYDLVLMLEKVKSIQQRFPQLCVMGFQSGCSISSSVDHARLIQLIMHEYITFPILMSKKNFPEIENGACYIIFKDFANPVFYYEKGLDLEILTKAIEELSVPSHEDSVSNLKSIGSKHIEVIKEPYSYSFMKNLLLSFPGSISSDRSGDRLFLSDSNHHRIIVSDGNGNIIDCIGSSPGFEDGEFDSAKLLRPAASFYDDDEDCLYFVDSENHAIRKADMSMRVLETLYPASNSNKGHNKLWTWIVNKLGFEREVDMKNEEDSSQLLMFPWHLMKADDHTFLIISRSFETLWIMDFASGEIKEVVKGAQEILDICGQFISEKVSLMKQLPHDWSPQQTVCNCALDGNPYGDFISALTTFKNHIIFCETVGQRILKITRESGVVSSYQFSNFGILGLPYWLSSPLERVYTGAKGSRTHIDHLQCFHVLPGTIDIQIRVEIPADVELVEPLHEGCIWRQARGAATEVSGAEPSERSLEKVGVSQQWYDELDNLAFSTPEQLIDEDDTTSVVKSSDGGVCIGCAVNTSPGTSEVIINTVLYLKLKSHELVEDNQEKFAARIADIMDSESRPKVERDSFIQFLLQSNRDVRDLIFMRPLHMKIQFDCPSHPKAENMKDVILTNSSIEVDVSLNS